VLLLLTTAGDGTSDRLANRLGNQVFRLNFDQLPEYKISFELNKWYVENPVGRSISSDVATKVLWWKAFAASPDSYDKYLIEESKYFFREIYSWFRDHGSIKGNSIEFHNSFGKMRIAKIASKYFNVPDSLITYQLANESAVKKQSRIVKSLSSVLVAEGKALFTSDVSNRELNSNFPWFIQEKIEAKSDLTFFVVGKKIFGFERSRTNLKGLDWRAEQSLDGSSEEWFPFEATEKFEKDLLLLNVDLGIEWGRYDFMLTTAGEIKFLEFNANGQWVFLDFNEKYGLLDCVVEYLQS
jgi:hypothetical protein